MLPMRMFVAVTPPSPVVEDLAEFLAPRRDAGKDLRWTAAEQWHVTLAFLPAVMERQLDDLTERLGRAAGRRTPFTASVRGGGAFPDVGRARVLYAGLELADDGVTLDRLATGARAAANRAGAQVEGGRFHPHLTIARSGRPRELTSWVWLLDAYAGPPWVVEEMALIESHLGEGPNRRPRHEVVATFPLGGPATPAAGGG
jgi:RNA 2',3'-cyclic 3'-phosphodiesterase